MSDKNLPTSARNYLTQAVFAGGEILAERYRIKRFIGKGGMGEVYLAEHLFTGQESALKVLPLRRIADNQMRRRMQREAAAGTKVTHPNLVQVRDGGITADNVVYIVMEYVGEHRTLRDYLNAFGPLAPVHWIAYAIQIAEGLAACHAAEVWHRDIKPENILVLPGARLKIIDLGLARVRTEALRTTGVGDEADGKKRTFATPLYASPEQLFPQDFAISEKTDIWSLGTVIYEMASGRHLWQQVTNEFPNATEASFAIATRTPPQLSDIVRSIPPDLSALIARCHRKDPSERPSALELGTQLAHWLQWARREPEPGRLRPAQAITDPLAIEPAAREPASPPVAAPIAPPATPTLASAAATPPPAPPPPAPPPDPLSRRPATIGVVDTETRVLVDYQLGDLPDSLRPSDPARLAQGTQPVEQGAASPAKRVPVPAQDTIDDRASTELYMKRVAALHAAPRPASAPPVSPQLVATPAVGDPTVGLPVHPVAPIDTDVTQATTGRTPVVPRRSRAPLLGAAISLVLVLLGSLVIVLRAHDPQRAGFASSLAAEPRPSAQPELLATATSVAHPPGEESLPTATSSHTEPGASLALPTPSPTMRAVSAPAPSSKPTAPTPNAAPSATSPFFLGRDRDPPPSPTGSARTPPWFIVQPDEAP